jgi:hypothetical protein
MTFGTELTAGANFDIITEPSNLADAYVGGTWAAKLTTTCESLTDWTKAISVNALCGTAAAMGTLGVVHSDSADLAGSTCLSFTWTSVSTAM